MFNEEDYKIVVNVPYAVIIASILIIIVTIGMTDENALKGLIGGYSGLALGILFIIILNSPPVNWLDLFPSFLMLGIIGLTMFYLYTYFDIIAKGEVSSYYNSFSVSSFIFLITQLSILFSAIFNRSNKPNEKLLSEKTFTLLIFLGVINYIMVITLGIVLKFYSTQG
jgi:hypothetical protein